MEMFLDGGELDFEDPDVFEEQYISDFNMDDNKKPEPSAPLTSGDQDTQPGTNQ